MKRCIVIGLLSTLFLLGIVLGLMGWRAWQTLQSPLAAPPGQNTLLLPKGAGVRYLQQQLFSHVQEPIAAQLFFWYARHQSLQLKAGRYAWTAEDSPLSLLRKMQQGKVLLLPLRLPEGGRYRDMQQILEKAPSLLRETPTLSLDQLQQALGVTPPVSSVEGLFFPSTYFYQEGDSDLDVLKQAYQLGQSHLHDLWAKRQPNLPLKTPYEALILASIVEKETGHADDRTRIAGVFINRLRRGMRLQADPTVIYGMGDKYQGRIRKVDLQTDTPWNTYTRHGLPPTPIASPSLSALQAVLQPEVHDFYYFVAKGDGRSAFAKTLVAHNRNVRQYILKKP